MMPIWVSISAQIPISQKSSLPSNAASKKINA
uniref:Uncharacterized protein MANES_02G043100 n=1 Tax=Rhizophora mucronata TaxID=61149 RepID=A0A2P2N9H9_RHIMU